MLPYPVLVLLLLAVHLINGTTQPVPHNLQLEYRNHPLGVDVRHPRFSFHHSASHMNTTQYAYQIQVYRLVSEMDGELVWDTDKVVSTHNAHIEYQGKPLVSDSLYIYLVKYWYTNCATSPTGICDSEFAQNGFTTGLFEDSDWHGAQWLDADTNGNMLITEFSSPAPGLTVMLAALYIVGLGAYTATINGRNVAPDEMHLHFTTYEKTVLYDTYDVIDHIKLTPPDSHQPNFLEIQVGHGWYSQPSINAGSRTAKCYLSIQYVDKKGQIVHQHITSNTNDWYAASGPVVSDDIYVGEHYDNRLANGAFTASSAMVSAAPPKGKLVSAALTEPIMQTSTYTAISITEPLPGTFVLDFGQNMAGITTLTVPAALAQADMNVTLQHSEILYESGLVQQLYTGVPGLYTYTMAETGMDEGAATQFVFYGFRYVQMTGYPGVPTIDTVVAHFIHTNMPQTNNILFSDDLLNRIQHATRMSSLSNFVSIPTDCPQRERRGWLGDAQITADTTIHNFYMPAVYTKFLHDIRDTQSFLNDTLQSNGDIPDCVPYYEHGFLPSDPAWGAAYTVLYYSMYKYYGDTQILTEHYPFVKQYVTNLLTQFDSDGTIKRSFFGDWCAGNVDAACFYPSGLVSTFYVILQLQILAGISRRLELHSDNAYFNQQLTTVTESFNKAYYAPTSGDQRLYADGDRIGVQTTHALPLVLDIVPDNDRSNVVKQLIDNIETTWHKHVSAGIVGTKHVFDVLSQYGRSDLALDVMMQRTQPSWGYMIDNGATALWETWFGTEHEAVGSRNHIMFGTQSAWYYTQLAGIQQTDESVAYRSIVIQPYVDLRPGKLTSVTATVQTIRGVISVAWQLHVAKLCGYGQQNGQIQLQCIAGLGTIQNIEFASFGTPTGQCGEFTKGTCDAKNSVQIVGQHCINQASCTLDVTSQFFGRRDPCPQVFKTLAVQASGCYAARWTMQLTLPVGDMTTVVIPLLDSEPSSVVLLAGENQIIWRDGHFVGQNVMGVNGAVLMNDAVQLTMGSGTYALRLAVPTGQKRQHVDITPISGNYMAVE